MSGVIPINGQFFTENETHRILRDMPKPLPCPFCGYAAVSVVQIDGPEDQHGEWYRASCGRCGAEAAGGDSAGTDPTYRDGSVRVLVPVDP